VVDHFGLLGYLALGVCVVGEDASEDFLKLSLDSSVGEGKVILQMGYFLILAPQLIRFAHYLFDLLFLIL
jgi:hypothetical protein